MPPDVLDYATPKRGRPRQMSMAVKWTLIVLGLVFAAAIAFVVLFLRYIMQIGPLDSH